MSFTATPNEGWDLSLYLVSSCDGEIADACLAGQDGALAETITYTPAISATFSWLSMELMQSLEFELSRGPAE